MSEEKEVVLHDWDNIIIQINKGDQKIGAIRAMKQDIDNMIDFHKMSRDQILELLVKTLETTPKPE
jgi:hypothetical protein